MSTPPSPLTPTWRGYIGSTMDALILFEACLQGRLLHVPRRPHDREREALIQSGNVFIYEEHSSGIKRWTDGYNWSPSRILGNFLVYRELDRDFPAGEKKKANKRKKSNTGGITKPGESSRSSSVNERAVAGASTDRSSVESQAEAEAERALVGSLVDSYPFKQDGLVKKTISVQWNGIPHHMVSYYNLPDVKSHQLLSPSHYPYFRGVIPRAGLISQQNFRTAVEEEDYVWEGTASAVAVQPSVQPHPHHAMPLEYGDGSDPSRGLAYHNAPYAMNGYTSTPTTLSMPHSMAPSFEPLSAPAYTPGPYPTHGHHHLALPYSHQAPLGPVAQTSHPYAYEATVSTGADVSVPLLASAHEITHGMLMNGGRMGVEPVMPPHELATREHHASILGHETKPEPTLSPIDATTSGVVHSAILGSSDPVYQPAYFTHRPALSHQGSAGQADVMGHMHNEPSDPAMGQIPVLNENWLEELDPQQTSASAPWSV